jgi:hypothetical protein
MWLINVANRQLELHNDERNLPRYAILSHTWSGTEVSMQEYRTFVADGCVTSQKGPSTPGLSKIEACCVQADKDKLSHLWIDTCCIDKTSSAELSEAINSMFRWYKNAEICYVHLEDINASVLEACQSIQSSCPRLDGLHVDGHSKNSSRLKVWSSSTEIGCEYAPR